MTSALSVEFSIWSHVYLKNCRTFRLFFLFVNNNFIMNLKLQEIKNIKSMVLEHDCELDWSQPPKHSQAPLLPPLASTSFMLYVLFVQASFFALYCSNAERCLRSWFIWPCVETLGAVKVRYTTDCWETIYRLFQPKTWFAGKYPSYRRNLSIDIS